MLRLEPESASAHFNYGNSLLAAGRGGEAIGRYEHALKLKPDYMEAMINLGMALSLAGKGEQSRQWLQIARSWFDKALKADPKNTTAMNNIGNVLRQQGKPEEAYSYYSEALRLRPDYMQAYINMASSLRDLGRLDEAIESCRAALRLQPDSTDARINLGASLQDMARHEEAIECFAEVLQLNPPRLTRDGIHRCRCWLWGVTKKACPCMKSASAFRICGAIILLPNDVGTARTLRANACLSGASRALATICNSSVMPSFARRGAALLSVLCPWPLRPLFRNCPFIDVLPESIEESDFDVHAPMMSLPYIFSTTVETIPAPIPYLFVSEAARAKWKDEITDKNGFRVGLVWSGNPRENQLNANMIDKRRSMTLAILLPLFDVAGRAVLQSANRRRVFRRSTVAACATA